MRYNIVENVDQRALRKWITAGLQIPEVHKLHGDAGYLLNNMIAKYTLAADTYAISIEALTNLEAKKVDLSKVHKRRTFYGKKSIENPFIYEHAVPAGVIRKVILSCTPEEGAVARCLQAAGSVAILLRTEDFRLKQAGMNSKMPEGWKIGDDPLARYKTVGITLSDQVLRVEGAICR